MVKLVTRRDLDTARREIPSAIDTTRRGLEAALDNLGLRLTVRMGTMLAAGLTLLGTVLKLHFIELLQLVLAVGSDSGIVQDLGAKGSRKDRPAHITVSAPAPSVSPP